jgi:hypothetical protein
VLNSQVPIPCAGTAQDGETHKGVALAYADNGDGTITDMNTGLTWEKKSDDGSVHDKDNGYPWVGTCSSGGATVCGTTADCATPGSTCQAGDFQKVFPGGQTIFQWVAGLNSGGFAGHNDWRVPSVRELQSIVNYENVTPAVSAAFNNNCAASCTVTTCSCTVSGGYWSSSTYTYSPDYAWSVYFYDGGAGASFKSFAFYVRAVRGGS